MNPFAVNRAKARAQRETAASGRAARKSRCAVQESGRPARGKPGRIEAEPRKREAVRGTAFSPSGGKQFGIAAGGVSEKAYAARAGQSFPNRSRV